MKSKRLPAGPFDFCETGEIESPADFVLRIPANIQSKGELLTALAVVGRFPSYFGNNWDALLDCLRDFGWIDKKTIVIRHSDLPLQANPQECRIYLELLREAVFDWARSPDAAQEPARSVDHDLRVIFPASLQSVIEARLK